EADAGLGADLLDHVQRSVLDGGLGYGVAAEAAAVPGEGGGGGEVEEVAADLVVDHVLEHGLVGVQDGVEVHIEHRVQLFHGERIPVARILADGKAGSAVYADIDRAVVFEGGGEQLVPGLALGGIADNGDG